MIQLIKKSVGENLGNIEISEISNPKSLDQYSINIIDLNDDNLWRYKLDGYSNISSINDFKSLGIMLDNSKIATNILILPQDLLFRYNYGLKNHRSNFKDYQRSIRLKDMLSYLKDSILCKIVEFPYPLVFENTNTQIIDKNIESSFYFSNVSEERIVSKSLVSDKVTSILVKEKIFITTLKLDSFENINSYLDYLGLANKKEDIPEWINDFNFFNDLDQKEKINNFKEKIDNLTKEISIANKQLRKNLKYKSVLYTNGDELVKVTFDILTIMLNYDLDSFIDEKKEDFVIKLDGVTLIGEIKGVNSNIKSGHISQLDVHYQGYLDNLVEAGQNEVVKSILIINHQRNKNINDRIPVHEQQINLAKRNGSLIIETTNLLKLFEKYKNNKLSTEEFIELLQENSGILTL